MWEKLGDKLSTSFKLSGTGKRQLAESDISAGLRQIRLALLEADVHLKVVKTFTNDLKEKLQGEEVKGSLNKEETIRKLIYDELVHILGDIQKPIQLKSKPSVIMFAGLQGTGKTTSVVKLALHLRKKLHRKILLVAGDIYRPAAIDQLVQLGKQLDINVLEKGQNNKVEDLCKYAMEIAKSYGYDTVIVDTAGRLSIDDKLMNELEEVKKILKPDEIILTLDATSGQDVLVAAEQFHNKLGVTGALLSKMDYDAKGGSALSLTSLLKIPIKFIGVGEKPSDLENFYPDRMAKRILDYGDIETLAERAKDVIDEKKAKKAVKRLMDGKFDLNDFLDQLRQMKKLDKLSGLLKMMPSFRKLNISKDMLENMDDKFALYETLILSMTHDERSNPKKLKDPSRKARVIKGSGRNAQEFNQLMNNWERAQQQMKMMKNMKHPGKGPVSGMSKGLAGGSSLGKL